MLRLFGLAALIGRALIKVDDEIDILISGNGGAKLEMGLRSGLVGQVERLRIVLARKFDHLLAGDFIAPERRRGARLEVFKVSQIVAHLSVPVSPITRPRSS